MQIGITLQVSQKTTVSYGLWFKISIDTAFFFQFGVDTSWTKREGRTKLKKN